MRYVRAGVLCAPLTLVCSDRAQGALCSDVLRLARALAFYRCAPSRAKAPRCVPCAMRAARAVRAVL